MNAQPINLDAIESLLAFWADAGVDSCLEDAPRDRTIIAPPPAARAVARVIARVTPPASGADEAIAEARRLAADAGTLDELAAAVAAFKGCPLRGQGARRAVFGRGDPQAPLLVIGEAPGPEEDQRGEPFVGPPGRLLDKMLAAAGLQGRAYIINSVFWRPPGNRPPSPQEQAVSAPFVERALAILKPRAVLLVGATAARSVLGVDENILRLRGQWRDWRLAEGGVSAPALATLHPAFLLTQPQAKRQAWADFLAVAARIDGDGVEDGATLMPNPADT